MGRHPDGGSVQLAPAELLVQRPLSRATRGADGRTGRQRTHPAVREPEEVHPADKLWPINDAWFFHAGSNPKNAALTSIRRAIDRRYGPSDDAEEFARKAQLAHYESTRAQFEAFAANGWDNHKMTIYWMLNNHWPSFFGHLFDYYLRPGGAYYGAKKGLRPLSVVFDSYATGDHDQANITVVNQSPDATSRVCGCACASTTCRAGCATTAPPTSSTSPPGCGASDDAAPTRLGLKGFLRPLRAVRQDRQRHRPTTCTGSRSNSTTSAIRATIAFELKQVELGRHDRAEPHDARAA